MDLKLYYAPGACSFVPHVALEAVRAATGQAFETQLVKLHKGEQRSPEHLALNPDGQVPVLLVDGQPLTQIVAICDFLDRAFPQAGLLPTEPWARARALSRLAWINNTVHPTFTRVFMPDKVAKEDAAKGHVREIAVGQYRELLSRIDAMAREAGGAFLLGERVSPLDAYAFTVLRWGGFAGLPPSDFPALAALAERVAQQPAAAAAMARENIKLEVPAPR